MSKRFAAVAVCIASAVAVASALAEGVYELNWSTVDGGGGTSSGGGYELSGTIGQPDATTPAALAGGNYQLSGGFWVLTPLTCSNHTAMDIDTDCDVDAADLLKFQACMSGPNLPFPELPICPSLDVDQDGDIDQSDYGTFQKCFSGTDRLADPNCGG